MRSGAVPFLISLTDTDEAPIPHVEGNEPTFLPSVQRRNLAQNHGVRVDIVVDRGKLIDRSKPHTRQNHIHHCFAVEYGELLRQLHVVNVVVKKCAFHIGKILGNAQIVLTLESRDRLLNLLEPALAFI